MDTVIEEGYLYCFSNKSMPHLLKIGMTLRTPEIRLKEANSSNTFKPPTKYRIEFAKKVINPKQKEKTLHQLLEKYSDRVNPKREFFRIEPDEVMHFFGLMDGVMHVLSTPTPKNPLNQNQMLDEDDLDFDDGDEEIEEEDHTEDQKEDQKEEKPKVDDTKRDMSKYFKNGQRIKHMIGLDKILIGTYNLAKNKIILDDGKEIRGLCGFANWHYKIEGRNYGHKDGYKTSYYEDSDGVWKSTSTFV